MTTADSRVVGTEYRSSPVPYKRGYSNPKHLKGAIAQAHHTNLGRSVVAAVLDQIVAIGAVIASATALTHSSSAWLMVITIGGWLLSVAIFGRQLRALENLVHEASHFNWSRRRRGLNNVLGYVLAALPVGARLADYRESHLRHHGKFGTEQDPDLERYRELDSEDMDRSSWWRLACFVALRFRRYQAGWLRTAAATPAVSLSPFAWFALTISVPCAVIGDVPTAVIGTAGWVSGYLLALPALRFVSESSEHLYRQADTVFEATVSNLGFWQRLIFHPHNDGFHTVHHLWPGIPHHQLRSVHRTLCKHDPDGYARRLRYRTGVMRDPVADVQ